MADIDKILNEAPTETIEEEKTEELIESPEIELEIDEGQDNVSLDPGAMDQGDDFAANLAEQLPDDVMARISNELRAQYEVDLTSRS